jgi:type VI protein secretion system component Hcp
VFANGERTKGVFTVYDRKYNPARGYFEYQLRDVYTMKMVSGWTREKELKPGT